MDSKDCLKAVRKYWWIVSLVILASVGVGALKVISATPMYRADVRFYVNTPADGVLAAFQGDQFGRNRVNSYVQLFDTEQFAKLVLADSGLDLTPDAIAAKVAAVADPTTVIINVSVTDPSALQAMKIAQSVAAKFPAMVAGLETPKGALTSPVQVDVVSGPTAEPDPVSPHPAQIIELAAAIGVLLGIGLAIAREALDKSVRDPDVLRRVTRSSCLGIVPTDRQARSGPVVTAEESKSVQAESFRRLRTNLRFSAVDAPLRVIAVTSPVAGEGKSSVAVHLALSFVAARRRVLLVDADLRRPAVGRYLGLNAPVGLTDVLLDEIAVEEGMQRWGDTALNVLAAGSIPPNPAELLGSQAMTDLLLSLQDRFDVVVLDTSPLLPVTDGSIVAQQADGVVLVVRHGATTKAQLANAARTLRSVRARLLGGVLNDVPLRGAESVSADYGLDGVNERYFDDPRTQRPRPSEESPEPVSRPRP